MSGGSWEAVSLEPRDRAFMDRAVALGRGGWGRVHPNPLVGCVLVRDGEVVGEGHHAEFGGPHAEVEALRSAGDRARGAEAFVSLEPCRHWGKTPPCAHALVAAGVTRVVYGAPDPGTESGGGAAELRRAGIEVVGPVLTTREGSWENPVFFHDHPERPWLALKLAVSLDAGIAEREGVRTRLSGPEAVRETHRLRAGFDGVLVGTKTALTDDPLLTVRDVPPPRIPPTRILLDEAGRIGTEARAFLAGPGAVWVVTTSASPPGWRQGIEASGAEVIVAPSRADAKVDLAAALALLRRRGMASILCEGGGELSASLLDAGLVDRLHLVLAPRFLGPNAVPAFPFPPEVGAGSSRIGGWSLGESPRRLGEDLWVALEPVQDRKEG